MTTVEGTKLLLHINEHGARATSVVDGAVSWEVTCRSPSLLLPRVARYMKLGWVVIDELTDHASAKLYSL